MAQPWPCNSPTHLYRDRSPCAYFDAVRRETVAARATTAHGSLRFILPLPREILLSCRLHVPFPLLVLLLDPRWTILPCRQRRSPGCACTNARPRRRPAPMIRTWRSTRRRSSSSTRSHDQAPLLYPSTRL